MIRVLATTIAAAALLVAVPATAAAATGAESVGFSYSAIITNPTPAFASDDTAFRSDKGVVGPTVTVTVTVGKPGKVTFLSSPCDTCKAEKTTVAVRAGQTSMTLPAATTRYAVSYTSRTGVTLPAIWQTVG